MSFFSLLSPPRYCFVHWKQNNTKGEDEQHTTPCDIKKTKKNRGEILHRIRFPLHQLGKKMENSMTPQKKKKEKKKTSKRVALHRLFFFFKFTIIYTQNGTEAPLPHIWQ
ncbi:hypothetical protein, unlikely [Trypanosoma brucei gambiense DAL972]|uniref:Uncharacterized protein n=1 Tax=Trypanosoma brucei gambiense (strain MHOM/CI/86/DAL972) TaxID=679716 RepID=D0A3Z0_TRYB9|nr:hypothetical protein, unlikely [Trypanosoma brucei gambiense DAL972]CBH15984.1 hypothetical protein, unlikely [Trypanosoma brucei gambiense DAL972]|eukprot:XP_011778248.1 hypothetical protein, unlikely [Trypanosoma brucei gambiense DAL972]